MLILALAVLVGSGSWPVYFVAGIGQTDTGHAILYATIAMFAISALMLTIRQGRHRFSFLYWYSIGLGLIAVGLAGVSLQTNLGDPLNWIGRSSQYLGTVFMLAAVVSSVRQSGTWLLPLERELREAEGRYQSLIALSPDGILVQVDENFIFANPAALRLFKMEDQNQLFTRNMLEFVHPDHRQTAADRIRRIQAGEDVAPWESQLIRSDGSLIDVEVTGSKVIFEKRSAVQAIIRDITERKRSDEAIRQSRRKFEQLFNSSNEGIALHEMIYDDNAKAIDYRVLDVNPSFEKMTQITRERAIGALASILYGTGTPPYIELYDKVVETGEPEYFEVFFRPMNKQFRISSFSPDKGQFATVFVDITALKEMENDLIEKADDLVRSNTELQQFAYVASHDLQEPLRMVVANLSLLDKRFKDRMDPKAQEYIKMAVEGGTRMRALIDDLLEYSRVDTRAKEFLRVDMNEVVQTVLQTLTSSIDDLKAEVRIEPLPKVMADPSQMTQVIQNILSNAIKFHGDERLVIHVSARPGSRSWTFAISDNGIGMKMEYAEKVFQMFQRLHSNEQYPGTGIGLAIVKKIIERHGGRIWLESEEGKGATFYFTIPNGQGGI